MTKSQTLLNILKTNPDISSILARVEKLNIPNWYLGAGGITQTVWNYFHKFSPNFGIKDYDLVYFDPSDLSYKAEDKVIKHGEKLFQDFSIPVEIKNEARVHLWYKSHFGFSIPPITSSENAISGWPTTATSIGLTLINNQIKIFAPFGLDDLLNLIIRPNKPQITREIYQNKLDRWQKVWPKLKIISWDE